MRTIAEPVEGSEVRVTPSDSPGIDVNGVPATLDAVAKADVRVDLANGTRTFVVEHVLGPLGLRGITAANVVGVRDEWDFSRPEHRFCYATGLGPEHVVGHPGGLPNPEISAALGDVDVVERNPGPRQTVSEPVTYTANGGQIELRPRERGAGVRFDVQYGDATVTANVDPCGHTDEDLVESVSSATTPYLSPTEAEAVTHSVADLVSDVAVIGGFDDLVVDATLADAYHALTVGAAHKAHETGVVEQRP